MLRRLTLLSWLTLPLAAQAAINPAEFTKGAPVQVQLRPVVQIVEHFQRDGDTHRRTTIVATVVAEHRDDPEIEVGDTVTIDWTVNTDALKRAAADYNERMAGMVGPQFMYAPNPPQPDADGLIWANLERDPAATAELPPAALDRETAHDADRRVGEVFVPAASQHSFDHP
ncbi:hypothetical protein [Arenimonas composti]|uniref:Uncharacterized protein n=1 Tax=Arenimonas composti TR7-09 = DSM 18010 TaxID=1121013 RepID=A0A091B7T9_9GAMM|nr:hypothetical protein [Arenimonas composti]KFN48733.1 hypothetical protein P873_13835 [Arenimonas composti TR7-09 = DSM 18010]